MFQRVCAYIFYICKFVQYIYIYIYILYIYGIHLFRNGYSDITLDICFLKYIYYQEGYAEKYTHAYKVLLRHMHQGVRSGSLNLASAEWGLCKTKRKSLVYRIYRAALRIKGIGFRVYSYKGVTFGFGPQ